MKKSMILTILISMVVVMSCTTTGKDQSSTSNGPKLVALTFDDGPNEELTALVLDKLEKYDVVASFFIIGQLVNESTRPTLERMVAMGCEPQNHSWGWESMNDMEPEEIIESVTKTNAAIKKYSGKEPTFFRPPNLSVSEEMHEVVGLPFASGVLGMDWAGCDTTAKDRANNVLNGMRDGAIVLLHDVQPYPHPTPEALDILIPALKKKGYEFVTLSELFRRKGVTPDPKEEVLWVYVD
ncbi:MAG TPA: polysaccharide deacetylase family protein [Treponema sp.]|nr:polysaccharide deacetylase family protein [Treponema sp.]